MYATLQNVIVFGIWLAFFVVWNLIAGLAGFPWSLSVLVNGFIGWSVVEIGDE